MARQLVLDLRPHPIALFMPRVAHARRLRCRSWLTAQRTSPTGVWWVRSSSYSSSIRCRSSSTWLTSNFAVTSDRVVHRHRLHRQALDGDPAGGDQRRPLRTGGHRPHGRGRHPGDLVGVGRPAATPSTTSATPRTSRRSSPSRGSRTRSGSTRARRPGGASAASAPRPPQPRPSSSGWPSSGPTACSPRKSSRPRRRRSWDRARSRAPGTIASMIGSVDHVYYWTARHGAAVAFYTDVVGSSRRSSGGRWVGRTRCGFHPVRAARDRRRPARIAAPWCSGSRTWTRRGGRSRSRGGVRRLRRRGRGIRAVRHVPRP